MASTVEFENDRVRVLRVKNEKRERHPQAARRDRLIIYLTDGHVIRTENGKREEIRRKAGDVVWRTRSQHDIENLEETHHEVVIVEFLK